MLTENAKPPFDFAGFYAEPAWLTEAFQYEKDIAKLLGGQPKVVEAARATLKRLKEVLEQYERATNRQASEQIQKRRVADAFFLSEPSAAQQQQGDNVGRLDRLIDPGTADPDIPAMMTAIYNAAYFRQSLASTTVAPTRTTNLSLAAILKERYLSTTTTHQGPSISLRLNAAALTAYAKQLGQDGRVSVFSPLKLLERVGKGYLIPPHLYDKDFYAIGSMAHIAGPRHELELSDSTHTPGRGGTQVAQAATVADFLTRSVLLVAGQRFAAFDNTHTANAEGLVTEYTATVALNADGTLNEQRMKDADPSIVSVAKNIARAGSQEAAKGPWVITRKKPVTTTTHTPNGGNLFYYVPDEVTVTDTELDSFRAARQALGPEFPVRWVGNTAVHSNDPDTAWYRATTFNRGFPVLAGISTIAARMMATFTWLDVPQVKTRHFFHALIVWLIGERYNTLYEILRGCSLVPPPTDTEGRHDFTGLLHDIDTIKAVPLYTRLHFNLLMFESWASEGDEEEDNPLLALQPIGVLGRVYELKTYNNDKARPFQDVRLGDPVEKARLQGKVEAASAKLAELRDAARQRGENPNNDRLCKSADHHLRSALMSYELGLWKSHYDESRETVERLMALYADRYVYLKPEFEARFANTLSTAGIDAEKVEYSNLESWLTKLAPRDKQKQVAWLPSFTAEQIMAIRYYCSPGYVLINAAARESDAEGDADVVERLKAALDRVIVNYGNNMASSTQSTVHIPMLLHRNDAFKAFFQRLRAEGQTVQSANNKLKAAPGNENVKAEMDAAIASARAKISSLVMDYRRALHSFTTMSELLTEVRMHVDMAYIGLREIPAFSGTTWRGIFRIKGPGSDRAMNFLTGIVDRPGTFATTTYFLSASKQQAVALGYAHGSAKKDPNNRLAFMQKLELAGGSGYYIHGISQNQQADELIILPGTTFESVTTLQDREYVGSKPGSNFSYVEMEFKERPGGVSKDLPKCSIYHMA